jgi:hypothetical protein
MVRIIDAKVNLEFPLGHHLHAMVAQIPNHLRRADQGYVIVDPDSQWQHIQSVLQLVAEGEGNLKKLHFLLFPETTLPVAHFDDMLAMIDQHLRPNSVTIFGVEHISLKSYRQLLERFRADNSEAIDLVDRDIDAGDVLEMPVNWCCIAVKEANGALRVFLEAKSHPFHGEEYLDKFHDLYRGRHFYLFRSRPSCFNFMGLICLDYLYRDLYASNIKQIIDHANQLYFKTRQGLDALFVIQCNPKPEHRAYGEVLTGFYGELLEDFPGVRETITLFGNCSDETVIEGYSDGSAFGAASVVINRHHKLAKVTFPEFATDDLGGAPLCRLRFGSGTRLYYFNLPQHHDLDPRTSRVPLKVHSIWRPTSDSGWQKISGDEMLRGYEIGRES